jgi:UDP-2-acetamido-3-amino-2,3-dideoxy-glucuronate N-acetyltransferase
MLNPAKPVASVVQLASAVEARGSLSVAAVGDELPFTPTRLFVVYDVPVDEQRGGHAHLECHQFLVAVHGSLIVDLHDGDSWSEVSLCSPTVGLYIPPTVWGVQRAHSAGAVLAVLASHPYDRADYVSDFETFLGLRTPAAHPR